MATVAQARADDGRGRISARRKTGLVLGALAVVASSLVAEGPAHAAFPGVNGVIACSSNRTGAVGFDVFTFNPSGTELNVTQLTNAAGTDSRPRYRSDGRLIAFESSRTGTSEIWIMNSDGTNQRQLTFSGNNSSPTWHPDGSQIMYQTVRAGQFQIAKINIDGTGEAQLSFTAQETSLPAWSPDGTQIAFSSRRTDPNADVHLMDPFGNNVVDLTAGSTAEDSWPAWFPDGSKIAFHSRRVDPGGEEIYRMNADGSNVVRLTNQVGPFDIFPFVSPDGNRIGWNSSGFGAANFGEIFHMNAVDGSDVRRVTDNPATDQRCDWQPLCTIYGSGDILGTAGDDVICGSEGPDRIAGQGGNDVIYGFGGDDTILGGDGNDRMFGGLGNDSFSGQVGTDFFSGGPGNDRIVADVGERVDPGSGTDTCAFGGAIAPCPPRLS
jgi:Tol biopolymer transport system component